eukprot:11514406-Alexandrium_andersonii.AAC.1
MQETAGSRFQQCPAVCCAVAHVAVNVWPWRVLRSVNCSTLSWAITHLSWMQAADVGFSLG